MPTALIFNQNPALQTQANHALKQRGFEPIARSGESLEQFLIELTPQILFTSLTDKQSVRTALLTAPFYTLFVFGEEDEITSSPPYSLLLKRPFKTELLSETIAKLTSEPLLPLSVHVELSLKDETLSQLLQLAFRARGISWVQGMNSERALFTLTDDPQSDCRGERLLVQSFASPLSKTLLTTLEEALSVPSPTKRAMPLTEPEQLLLKKTVLKEFENTLNNSRSLKHRDWSGLIEELNLSLSELFRQ